MRKSVRRIIIFVSYVGNSKVRGFIVKGVGITSDIRKASRFSSKEARQQCELYSQYWEVMAMKVILGNVSEEPQN